MKNVLNMYFDGGFSTKFYKKIFLTISPRSYSLCSAFIRPEFRLDILLWRLNIFPSLYYAESAIYKKYVLVNGNKIGLKYFVKEGDIILINKIKLFKFYNNNNLFIFSKLLPAYVEVDFYVGQIVIIKKWQTFLLKDFTSIVKESLKFSKIKNYFLC